MRGELVKGVANRHAQLAGLDGVVLDVLHRVQALDDAVARGLRAQAQLLHLLDQLALAVTRRRLGLLLGALGRRWKAICCPSLMAGSCSSFFMPYG